MIDQPDILIGKKGVAIDKSYDFSKIYQKEETFSAMSFANAKSLGLLAGYLANKGSFQGKQFKSEQTWKEF